MVDPALAARLLGVDTGTLLGGITAGAKLMTISPTDALPRDGTLLGQVFESLVTQSVRVYAQAAEARVYHCRTYDGRREVDLIIETGDHRVLALEVKASAEVTDADVRHLVWLREQLGAVLTDMVVITTGRHAYRRQDGVAVVPAEYGKPDGIPLLLFHGTPGSRIFGRFENATWIEKSGLRVITPERPGFGLSDPAPRRAIGDWADDVEELANQLGVDRFHVAGGSGGGPYALACAIHLPERVLSATLFSSGVPPEVVRLSKGMQTGNRIAFLAARYAPFLLKRLLAGTANTVRRYPEKYWAHVLAKSPESDRRIMGQQNGDSTITHVQEAFRQGVDGAYHDMLLVSRPWGLDFRRISVPVFMWHGTADTFMPISSAREFAKQLPGCEPHFIPDAGHQLFGSEEVRSQMIARILSVGA